MTPWRLAIEQWVEVENPGYLRDFVASYIGIISWANIRMIKDAYSTNRKISWKVSEFFFPSLLNSMFPNLFYGKWFFNIIHPFETLLIFGVPGHRKFFFQLFSVWDLSSFAGNIFKTLPSWSCSGHYFLDSQLSKVFFGNRARTNWLKFFFRILAPWKKRMWTPNKTKVRS